MRTTIAEFERLARSGRASKTMLKELAGHSNTNVRTEVAANPRTPSEVLLILTGDKSAVVRQFAALNPSLDAVHENRLAFSDDLELRLALTSKSDSTGRSLSLAAQEHLASDSNIQVRAAVASSTNYRSVYERLLVDPDAKVRAACAQNAQLTNADAIVLASDPSWKVRSGLALRPDGPIPNEEQLQKLASDKSVNVRWAVAARLTASVEILRRLALDPETDVRDQATITLQEQRDRRGVN